jgi:hypothetical protein
MALRTEATHVPLLGKPARDDDGNGEVQDAREVGIGRARPSTLLDFRFGNAGGAQHRASRERRMRIAQPLTDGELDRPTNELFEEGRRRL